jgi:hypothetical protein
MKIFILIIFISNAILISQTLKDYAKELPKASSPGYFIKKFVSEAGLNLAPDQKIAILYKKLLKKWKYQSDPAGYDHFSIAEYLMRRNNLTGDCEDFASVLISVCRIMNLKCQVALGKKGTHGHAWTEVFITADKILNKKLYLRLKNQFGKNARIVHRSNGFWLQLNPEKVIEQYKTSYIIKLNGKLIPIKY